MIVLLKLPNFRLHLCPAKGKREAKDEEDEGRFGAILVNYRQIEEIPSVLSAGRLQMRHEKSRAPTYRTAAELSGVQFQTESGAQFENAIGPNHV
ncbi:hypothetical protein E2C01_024084 [Portunus trituberculatus]|uniref:Uncharacterized protein n=1 Tax=Portunus trituberculatus TaxID=210409 RepID=A0A5B7EBS2_PORTR|nr:hypothetical protein [Portunus trituberculatus]